MPTRARLPIRHHVALLLSAFSLQAFSLYAETLTIATYNVNNYLITTRIVQGAFRKDYPKPETEKTALRANIKALDADIIALQEMGARPFLDELLRDLKHDGADYPYAELLDSPDDPDRHLAVLSRRPFTLVRKHTDLTFKYFDAAKPSNAASSKSTSPPKPATLPCSSFTSKAASPNPTTSTTPNPPSAALEKPRPSATAS